MIMHITVACAVWLDPGWAACMRSERHEPWQQPADRRSTGCGERLRGTADGERNPPAPPRYVGRAYEQQAMMVGCMATPCCVALP